MFYLRKVRDAVVAKIACLRNVSEEDIHVAYAREISAELHDARQKAESLLRIVTQPRAKRPGSWIMISQEDATELAGQINDLIRSLS